MAPKKPSGLIKVKSGQFVSIEGTSKIMTENTPATEDQKKVAVTKFIKIPCIKADGTSEEISVPQRGETELPRNNIFLEPISNFSYKIIKKHSYPQTNKSQEECACRNMCNCYKDLFKLYEELKQKYDELNMRLQGLEKNKVLNELMENEMQQTDNVQSKESSRVVIAEVELDKSPVEDNMKNHTNEDNIYENAVFVNPNIISSPLIGSNVNMGTNLDFPKVQNGINDSLQMKVFPFWVKCDIPDDDGYYPIHHAVMDIDLLSLTRQCIVLKLKNCDINLECSDGLTPLHMAVMYNAPIEITKLLLRFGAAMDCTDDLGNNCFHIAANKNYLKTLQALDVWQNTKCLNECNHDGYTPLMISATENNVEDVNTLIEHGADLNITDKKSGRTALFYAVDNNAVESVKLLMKAEADISIKNFAGLTVMDMMDDMTNLNEEIKLLIFSKSILSAQKRKLSYEKCQTAKRIKQ